jgi:hypothetical protein
MMTLVWTLFLAFGATCAFIVLLAAVHRWPIVGGVGIAVSVLIAWEVPQPSPLLVLAGSNVYLPDILAVMFLLIGLFCVRTSAHRFPLEIGALAVIGILLGFGLVRGIAEFPVGTVVNDFRSFFYPLSVWLWSLSFRRRALHRDHSLVTNAALVLGWALTAVAMYHLLRYGLGSVNTFVNPATGYSQTSRILVAGQAVTLLLCVIVVVAELSQRHRTFRALSAIAFCLVIVLALERSAWVAGIVAAAVAFLLSPAKKKNIAMVVTGTSAIILIIVVALWGTNFSGIFTSLMNAASSVGTYDGRTTSWANLFATSLDKGPIDFIFGQPLGTGYGRFEGAGRWVDYAPHNWYLTVYLRTGIVGLMALILMLISGAHRMLRRPRDLFSVAILTAAVVYGWTYSWPWYLTVFVGLAYVESDVRRLHSEEPGFERWGVMMATNRVRPHAKA